jgi:tuftelin-interacting protein 11
MNRSLANKAHEELVLMLQEMFIELWKPLKHPKRWMEVLTKLKEILLDDGSASSLYAALLTELVVGPNLTELRRSWTIDYPRQDELVLFLQRLLPQLPPV